MSRYWLIALLLLPRPTLGEEDDVVEQLLAQEEQQAELVELPMGDPTQPPDWGRAEGDTSGAELGEFRELVLQEVLISPARRLAVINDQTVMAGGWVDGAAVIEINMYDVLIRRDGETIALSLSGTSIKQPVQDQHERNP